MVFANLGDTRAVTNTVNVRPVEDNSQSEHYVFDCNVWTKQSTFDHKATHEREAARVTAQSRDPRAVRRSANAGTDDSVRVAGSLAITRSFGDFYLKYPEFSQNAEVAKHLPYLIKEPFFSSSTFRLPKGLIREFSAMDFTFVVIASDGLWDYLSNQDVMNCAARFLLHNRGRYLDMLNDSRSNPVPGFEHEVDGTNSENVTEALLHLVLTKIAKKRGTTTSALLKAQPGSRRSLFDDTTITVIVTCGRTLFHEH